MRPRHKGRDEAGALPNASVTSLVSNRLGSGSDYTVFLNFLGVPIVDMAYDGPYGVYHSIYDDHLWVARVGDPGFRFHTALTSLWGVMALRLANADVLPFDFRSYATALAEFTTEVEKRWTDAHAVGDPQASPFAPVHTAVTRFSAAAERASGRADSVLQGSREDQTTLNRALMGVEHALTDPDGIPGRPWYRHQIYAPKFTYAPEILPGPAEAIVAGDEARLRQQCARVAAAITRAAETLER